MKNLNKLVLFAAFILLPVAVSAQGSGSSDTNNKPKKNNFAVTRSVSGTLNSQSAGSIVVKIKNGENISLVLTNKTRFITRPKVGQRVKVIYSANNKKAIVVRKL